MNGKDQAFGDARKLFLHHNSGILSTLSVENEIPGYPFGSLTPYAPDYRNRPVLLLSEIAEHTHNIQKDARVSLTIAQAQTGEVQAQGRVTIVGDARLVAGDDLQETSERYFAYFPYAREYMKAHNFSFFRIEPKKVRYIGGFGKIFWVPLEDFAVANPFGADDQEAIVGHMNADHADALRRYLERFKNVQPADGEDVVMVSIDAEGCDLRYRRDNHRIDFEAAIATKEEARAVLTKMARES